MAQKKKNVTKTSEFVSETRNVRNGPKTNMKTRPPTTGQPVVSGFICSPKDGYQAIFKLKYFLGVMNKCQHFQNFRQKFTKFKMPNVQKLQTLKKITQTKIGQINEKKNLH